MDHRKPKKDLSRITKRHMRRLCKADAEMIQDALLQRSHHDVPSTSAINYEAEILHEEESTIGINIQELNTEENEQDTYTERRNTRTSSDEDAENLNTEFPINSSIEETNDMTDESFQTNLAKWAISHQIQHNAMNALLTLLKKHKCHTDLPSDVRTLLKTPRITRTRSVPPGEYYHFGLQKVVKQFLEQMSQDNSIIDSVKIAINIDGIPLSKSSSKQFWPILGSIIPYKEVFTIGIYYGDKKCNDVNDFLAEFVDEAKTLCSEGIFINGENVCCKIDALICDTPAKAFVLCTKGHMGYSSCSKCTTTGENLGNRICFPQIDAAKRTDESFSAKIDEDYHNHGITSSLEQIPNFGLVTNVPLDYMHLVCLGVMRKLMYFWISGELTYRLQYRKQQEISSCLINGIKPYIPVEFARKPRSLDCIRMWKATEYRQVLLYSGPVIFNQSLPKKLYIHFLTLHVVMRIMSAEELFDILDYAHELVKNFITSFALLYGAQHVSHNVHNLIHLVDDVKKFGPVDRFSAFKYENYLQTLKRLLRKADKPLQQVVRRYRERENITSFSPLIVNSMYTELHYSLKSQHSDGPLLNDCENPQYRTVKYQTVTFEAGTSSDSCCGLTCGAIIDIENIAHCTQRKIAMIIGREFLEKQDFFTSPCPSSLIGIYLVNTLSPLKAWPLKNVMKKYVKIPQLQGKYVVFPLLHHED